MLACQERLSVRLSIDGRTEFGRDAFSRRTSATDARNGATWWHYNAADLLFAAVTPPPRTGLAGLATTNFYNTALRLYRTRHPDGATVDYEYYPTGLRKKASGAREYPVEYTYDSQGRLRTMTNWQSYATSAGAAVTTWNYDAYTGLLQNKRYQKMGFDHSLVRSF